MEWRKAGGVAIDDEDGSSDVETPTNNFYRNILLRKEKAGKTTVDEGVVISHDIGIQSVVGMIWH